MTEYLSALQGIYFFLTLSFLFIIIGRAVDAVHFKLAIKLRKYLIYGISTVIGWFLLDAGTLAGGKGSTVLDVTVDPPVVLREGTIPARAIQELLDG